MNRIIKKVIKASAGTGKTYRLSLEFINLLLQGKESYPDSLRFEEILVITFTKKATAEIRNAIFSHINNLLHWEEGNEKGKIIKENLDKLFGRQIAKEDLVYLNDVYKQMLTNKHKLSISTIDSFITSIFKSIIAPYMGIVDFEIKNDINQQVLPEIYAKLMETPDFLNKYLQLFRTAKLKTIESYDSFIKSIIDNRILVEMIGDRFRQQENNIQSESILQEYLEKMRNVVYRFRRYLAADGKNNEQASKLIKKEYLDMLSNLADSSIDEWLDVFERSLHTEWFVYKNRDILLTKPDFWNGGSCFKKNQFKPEKEELMEILNSVKLILSGYITVKYLLPEQELILGMAVDVLTLYDEIKMRDRIFTYSDITYYTYKKLYDPELSLIDEFNGTVENRFYEYLSTSTRYILIDEYQDTSILQHKILLPIIKEVISGSGIKDYGGVTIVGDEKQSIYGWRSGERELLLQIGSILQGVETHYLDTSYRSTRFITDFINTLFKKIAVEYETTFYDEDYQNGGAVSRWDYSEVEAYKSIEEGYLNISLYNKSKSVDSSEQEPVDPYIVFVEEIMMPVINNNSVDINKSVLLASTNTQLERIASLLEESGIPCFREATISVIQHQAVKPIIYLLQFLNTRNILHLLHFLRSDFVLMQPVELKQIIDLYREVRDSRKENGSSSFIAALKDKFSQHPIIKKILVILDEYQNLDLIALVARIMETFNIIELFPEEYNAVNINLFVEVVADFVISTNDNYPYEHNINGFLDYLKDNEYSESLTQNSPEKVNALQLLTVHKAKGLQYETVFYFCEDIRKGGAYKDVNYYYRYDEKFTDLAEGCLTFNYDKAMTMNDLYRFHHYRKLMEALNVIYVALTRAERNIFLFMTYTQKEGIPKYINDFDKKKKEDKKMFGYFFSQIVSYLQSKGIYVEEKGTMLTTEFGSLPKIDREEEGLIVPLNDTFPYREYLSLNNSGLIKPREETTFIDYKSVYVINKLPLLGEIVHYYLSHIRYGTTAELQYAAKRTISFFGNILSVKKIDDLITKANLFIEGNGDLFSPEWSKIFTERIVFDQHRKEYRIDRLMIDEVRKRILIVDYKTGSIDDKNQLLKYKSIIAGLPYVKDNGYSIDTRYMEVELGNE